MFVDGVLHLWHSLQESYTERPCLLVAHTNKSVIQLGKKSTEKKKTAGILNCVPLPVWLHTETRLISSNFSQQKKILTHSCSQFHLLCLVINMVRFENTLNPEDKSK